MSWFVRIVMTCKEFGEMAFNRGNPYGLEKANQDKLVNQISSNFVRTILKPLHRSHKENIRDDLKNELAKTLDEVKDLFGELDENVERHDQLLKKRGISSYSALIEAYDPEIVRQIFEKTKSIEMENYSGDEISNIELTWDEYYDSAYSEFYRDLKKLLPDGPHSEFYKKRVLDKNTLPSKTQIRKKTGQKSKNDTRNKLLNDAKEHADKKNASKVQDPIESKSTNESTLEESKNLPLEPKNPPNISTKNESNINQYESNEMNNVSTHEHPPTQHSRPSPAPRPRSKYKSAKSSKPAPKLEAEPVPKAEPIRESESPKPKMSLLEQMAILSESKEQQTAVEHKQLSYPPIFKNKNWKKYWSNAKPSTGSAWKEFFWNCNSIGKDYLMQTKSREKLVCDLDVNQDFAVVNPGKASLRAILFDGVSQSRAPRQWAECLAESYIEQKLNIDKLIKHSIEVEEWHSDSLAKWNQWIEQHYLPKRQHLPEWRLKNEVESSFTTFVVLEVDSKMVRLTNLGDSAIFCKLKSGEIKSLPSTYNHLLRPKNISTQKLYESSDMEFTSFSIDDVDSILACTDSIADYIFDSDEAKMNLNYTECLSALSTKGDKFDFMSKMIAKGPSNGGWLEDDVTFFSLVRNEQSVSRQMGQSIEDVNETAIDGEEV